MNVTLPITGRCYSGARHLHATAPPITATYCHSGDCRRITGVPVGAFAVLAPERHSHTESRLSGLHIADDHARNEGNTRQSLKTAQPSRGNIG